MMTVKTWSAHDDRQTARSRDIAKSRAKGPKTVMRMQRRCAAGLLHFIYVWNHGLRPADLTLVQAGDVQVCQMQIPA